MRTETIRDRKININPLTRKQIKGLREYGFGPAFFVPTMETLNDAWDAVLPIAVSAEDHDFLDGCTPVETAPIWKAILEETYGSPAAEKNLQSTGDGSTIAKE